MPGNFATTANFALRKLLGTSKGSDIDEGFDALAKDVDTKMVGLIVDTFAKRPAAGIPNRIFRASDTGAYYFDTGAAWEQLLRAADGLVKPGVYSALVGITAAVEQEPSATRPTLVSLVISTSGAGSGEVVVGGKKITGFQTTAAAQIPFSFICPAAVKWKWAISGGAYVVEASYLTL